MSKFGFLFLNRFIILRRRPTMKKLICTLVVMLCLFVCLMPKIIPSIDNSKSKHSNPNAATGAAAAIWPIIFILSFVSIAYQEVYLSINFMILRIV